MSEEKKNEKESEKKFVPKKIVLNFEDDSLELKVNQDDLFEADDTPVKELLQCSVILPVIHNLQIFHKPFFFLQISIF